MENIKILTAKFYKMANLVTQEMETSWLYGVDFPLHHAQVHLLETIKSQEGVNVSELARHLGMTSGAVSQVTKKLLDKGLIETYKKPGNRKEVFSRLTALGEMVCRGHQRHHENMLSALREFMNRLNVNETQVVLDFLDAVNAGIEKVFDNAKNTA
ncbi:MAG: MarR family transcriptional regulator [Acidaminococcales bacterium]|jgi:DNA-binding MarR family transcriptional regulator|nr:MarR family transcriptional regulator [Acidaminococcales bacterium]